MCIASPARVIALEEGAAVVDVDGRRRRAALFRGPAVAVGDWVLVAAGSVIRRISPEEASDLGDALRAARATVDGGPLQRDLGGPP